MNLIPKIVEMLGVEIGERFEIDGTDRDSGIYYYFTETELIQHIPVRTPDYAQYRMLADLIMGDKKIIKLPFEPKDGERYWYVCWDLITKAPYVTDSEFCDVDMCCHHKYCGNCFRTEAEAERHKYEIYEKLTGKKWVVAE